jgi:hypothetical protein
MVIRIQNAKDGLTGEEWTRNRFYGLCKLVRCQPEEILERYFVSQREFKKWMANDSIPAYVSLHFILLERSFLQCEGKKKVTEEQNRPRHD